ncbi:hypothetical protein [Acinetobacter sp. ANC 3813]|nr:hypothetical protein [Acinetobacter sp. ANC 3813]
MKIVQEENLPQAGHSLISRYQIEPMACLFFALGMMICAYLVHTFIL